MNNQKGFGIIEVLIAMGIFLIGMTAICQMYVWSVKLNSNSNFISLATNAASSVIETIKDHPVAGNYTEKIGVASVVYTITPTTNPRVSLVVATSTVRGKSVTIETYLK